MKERQMDFIEQIFGFSPDAGDGSFEVAIIGAIVLLIVLITWRRLGGKILG
jgi:hypothetical protein